MKPLRPLELPLAGVQLIEASAGTGKTYTITTLVLRLLLEQRLRIDQILVVTFTNAATAELRQRVRARIADASALLDAAPPDADPEVLALLDRAGDRSAVRQLLSDALRNLDEAAIFTIHGFCQRVLSEFAFESGLPFDLELIADDRPLLTELVRDFWARELYRASEAKVEYLRRSGLSLPRFEWLARLAVGWPRLKLAPRAVEVDPDQSVADYLTARAEAAPIWERDKESIKQLLRSPGLNANSYRRDSVDGWCECLDRLLGTSAPTLHHLFPKLDKFTRPALEKGTKSGHRPPEHPFFDACTRLYAASQAASRELGAWALHLQQKAIVELPHEFARKKRERSVMGFDDLLQQLESALRGAHGERLAQAIRSRYPAALIDEFQDTDPVQYDIFRSVYRSARGPLLLIGDPKQAIYAFRGADVFAYLKAAKDSENAAWTLNVNYRSGPTLLRALNTLFSRVEHPFVLPEIGYTPVRARSGAEDRLRIAGEAAAPLQILFIERDGSRGRQEHINKSWGREYLPRATARQIAALLASDARIDGRAVAPGDVAVLTRTNREALDVQRELRSLRVPSVLHGDASVLDTPEAEDISYLVTALADPTRRSAIRAALATPIFGLGAAELFTLLEDEDGWERWIERFQRWHHEWQERGFIQAFRAVLRDERVAERVLGQVGGERKLTNLLHLSELLHQAAREHHLGISGLVLWLEEVRADAGAREGLAPDAMQIRLESDERAVQLTTMHRSKGLEYPIVYCPFVWDGSTLRGNDACYYRFHDPDTGELVLDFARSDLGEELAKREVFAENLRLLYVALTRAKHRCVIFWGAFKEYAQSALAYLLHQPKAADSSLAGRLHKADDALLWADLAQFEHDSEGAVQVLRWEDVPEKPYEPPVRQTAQLAARERQRRVLLTQTSSSFSGLIAARRRLSTPAELGLDHDPVLATESPADGATAPDASGAVALAAFPRGTHAGEALHAVFEHLDFAALPAAEQTRTALEQRGIDAEAWTEVVHTALAQILNTPLAPHTFALSQVPASKRLNELEFVLPVGAKGHDESQLTPARLAAVFAAEGQREYADALRRLSFGALAGFLRGFIDLVFEHDGKWFVADYKSNHLGDFQADYAQPALARAMAEHHYYLQYQLYVVALHRLLSFRQPGYDYERHFGGVFYLFLRGMTGAPGGGVLFDRPPLSMVERLSNLLTPAGARS